MRVVRLILLGLLIYLVSLVFLFPAAPIVERFKPQLQPMALFGVSGKLYKGEVESVVSQDDLLPLTLTNVKWALSPAKLFSGTGASVSFDALGGSGSGEVLRTWGGNLTIEDFTLDAVAGELEEFLPVPIATFEGKIDAEFDEIKLVNQQLKRILGQLRWNNAIIDTVAFGPQLNIVLGNLNIDIDPQSDGAHKSVINASGGDIAVDGSVTVAADGNFNLDVLLTPGANAPAALINHLRRTTRPESGGRFRWQQNGNVNRLM